MHPAIIFSCSSQKNVFGSKLDPSIPQMLYQIKYTLKISKTSNYSGFYLALGAKSTSSLQTIINQYITYYT